MLAIPISFWMMLRVRLDQVGGERGVNTDRQLIPIPVDGAGRRLLVWYQITKPFR
jgi:hypothetical protein